MLLIVSGFPSVGKSKPEGDVCEECPMNLKAMNELKHGSVSRSDPSREPGVLLSVEGLEKRFGGLRALYEYGVRVRSGELIGLIGPNGAGKTTVFNLLSGVLKPTSGRILFDGRDITGFRPDQNARLGIARTFQNIRLFENLSVMDNIKVAFHMRHGQGFWPTVIGLPHHRRAERHMEEKAIAYLAQLGLSGTRSELARNLPYGLQRRVEIARALATGPRLLLLDEPAAGMNPQETDELVEIIREIHQRLELSIFLVEHDMSVVMAVSERIQVLDQGKVIAEGPPELIRNDPRVITAYLGAPKDRCDAPH
jgi:branched-chain amino acid transport system ATP-binding protein